MHFHVLIEHRHNADWKISRYTAADLQTIPQAEVIVGSDGEVILSGIDPVRWTI